MYHRASRSRGLARRRRELERLSHRLQDIAADTGEGLAQARELQAQLYNLAQSVLWAASQLQRMRR